MAMKNCCWWQAEVSTQPLDAIRQTVDALQRGVIVPPGAAKIIADALRQYLAGNTDITRNLGLRPRRGGNHETPLALERAHTRDDAIKKVYNRMTAPTKNGRAEQTALLLRSPPNPRVTEAEVFAYVTRLHTEFGGTLPTSMRQVIRVVDGDTVAARK